MNFLDVFKFSNDLQEFIKNSNKFEIIYTFFLLCLWYIFFFIIFFMILFQNITFVVATILLLIIANLSIRMYKSDNSKTKVLEAIAFVPNFVFDLIKKFFNYILFYGVEDGE